MLVLFSLLKMFPQKSFPKIPLSHMSSILTQHRNSSWVQELRCWEVTFPHEGHGYFSTHCRQ